MFDLLFDVLSNVVVFAVVVIFLIVVLLP